MRRARLLAGIVSFATCLMLAQPACTVNDVATSSASGTAADASNAFAFDLYAELGSAEANLGLCPLSIDTALAMTYAGAQGETAEQMRTVLHLPSGPQAHEDMGALGAGLATLDGGVSVDLANRLWVHDGYPLRQDYLDLLGKHYQAPPETVDFVRAPGEAIATINQWVGEATHGKVPEIVTRDMIDSLTRLVITNAVHFKGLWKSPFDPAKTRDRPFHVKPDETVDVPMMNQLAPFRYTETEQLQLIELPYEGDALSMVVLLPKERDGLASLERGFGQDELDTLLAAAHETQIQVALPRFQVDSAFCLKKALIALGMTDAFDASKADFSGLTDDPAGLYITAVAHKTRVEVNEEGTEAAGATAVVMSKRGMLLRFQADHPFLFLIRDTRSNAILFLGQVANPVA